MDQEVLDYLKRTINRDLLLISNKKIVNSTLYFFPNLLVKQMVLS